MKKYIALLLGLAFTFIAAPHPIVHPSPAPTVSPKPKSLKTVAPPAYVLDFTSPSAYAFGVDPYPVTVVPGPSPLPVTSAPNTAGTIANNAAITTSAYTFVAPANAVGFLLEAESSNTANVRWAIGSTATSSVGTIAEPGRDSGYIPGGASISVVAISGTQAVSVQWIKSQ